MAFNNDPPSAPEIDRWFLANPPVAEQTFELALVLGGTVSAGAYTAGALDFLIEALDCWEAARGDPQVPQHRVMLRVITGTSGGGVNAAIAARALNFDFPHVRQETADHGRSGNPFYDCWINDLTLDKFLSTTDGDDELISLLNGKAIDAAANRIVGFPGTQKPRPWLAAPLRLILTLTNLAGVPYRLDLSTGSETFVDHADHMRFAVNYPGSAAAAFRPDELLIDFGQGVAGAMDWDRFMGLARTGTPAPAGTPVLLDWTRFSEFAKGTAAFPAGFPPRELTRPADHYRWRVVPLPNPEQGQSQYFAMIPDWDAMQTSGAASADGQYFFLVVDGGATDNEPIELARTALCGILGTNPRGAADANRAVVLVDPFAGKAELGRQTAGTFADNLTGILNAMIQQTRYDSRDVMLAADKDVFSRFMLAPRSNPQSRQPAITSAGLGAFIGFACPAFMRYDYMLGRRNCRDFLFKEFKLAENNKIFGAPWTDDQKKRFAAGTQPGHLPIIPLIGTAAQDQPLDRWPRGRLDPDAYHDAIERRFRALLEAAIPGSPLNWLKTAGWLGGRAADWYVADKVIAAMKKYLSDAELN